MTSYPMRYASRAVSDDEARTILDSAEFVVISSADDDGTPYGVPVSFVREGNALYLHSAKAGGHKAANFARDPRVCATAVTDVAPCYENGYFSTRYASVIARGRIEKVADEAETRRALAALCLKYVPSAADEIEGAIERGIRNTAVWRLDVEELSGKAGRDIG